MSDRRPAWLTIERGGAPLVVSVPHSGTEIPETIERTLVSTWLSRKDADWYVDRLYDFARALDATVVRTSISRTVIDVNRPPDGASLYPGLTTTGLCPTTTFDQQPLYRAGYAPSEAQVAERRERFHAPYHAALAAELARLRERHSKVVLYDAHSIRSVVPALFAGELPVFNIGTNDGLSCDARLERTIAELCAASGRSHVVNGRFKGGYITRHYGRPAEGVHAVQMELACRSYLPELPSPSVTPETWPVAYDQAYAAETRAVLRRVLTSCLEFATAGTGAAS